MSTESQQVDGSDYVSPLGHLCFAAFLGVEGMPLFRQIGPPCEEQEASADLESDTQSHPVEG